MITPTIQSIHAQQILDSRGIPTLETTVTCSDGSYGTASVPSGTSSGEYEAWELRDGDLGRYQGKGVLKAIASVNETLTNVLKGKSIVEIPAIDQAMQEADGTENKRRLGANAMLSVSLAIVRAAALSQDMEVYQFLQKRFEFPESRTMPIPLMNVVAGKRHAHNNNPFQEYWIVPIAPKTYAERIALASKIFHQLKIVLERQKMETSLGLEGGYAPNIQSVDQIWEALHVASKEVHVDVGTDVVFGMDAAASELYDPSTKQYAATVDGSMITAEELLALYRRWHEQYHVQLLEDGYDQEAWRDWQILTKQLGSIMTVIGDDLFATNVRRLQYGIEQGVANAMIIKPNQIGTVTGTMETIRLARQSGYKVAISHRSGETRDPFIADLSVAVGADYLKAGALIQSERRAKHDRMVAIEQERS